MNHWLKTAFGWAALGVALPAAAEPSVLYGRIDGGASFSEAFEGNYIARTGLGAGSSRSGLVNIGLGAALPIPILSIRSEIDLTYRPDYNFNETSASPTGPVATRSKFGDITSMLNVILDVPVPFLIKPFVGLGAGLANNRLSAITTSGGRVISETGQADAPFAWDAIAGISYSVAPGIGLDLTYRYVDAGDIKTGGIDGAGRRIAALHSELKTRDAMIGLRIGF